MISLHERVRAAIGGLGGYPAWQAAIAVLDRASDDEVRAEVDAIDAALAGIAREHRIVPKPWGLRLLREGREPRARLCRAIQLWEMHPPRADVDRLLASDDIARATHLDLSYADLDAAAMPALVRRLETLPVTSLRLDGNRVEVGLAEVLALSTRGPLTHLSADSCGASDETLAALAARGVEVGLQHLSLELSYMSPRGVASLLSLPGMERLASLQLSDTFLAAGVEALAARPMPGLRALSLRLSQAGDRGAAALAGAGLDGLEDLNLFACDIGDDGARALAGATHLGALRALDLSHNRLGAEGARALFHAAGLSALRRLRIDQNWLGPELADIIDASPVERFEELGLADQGFAEWNFDDPRFDEATFNAARDAVRDRIEAALRRRGVAFFFC